MSNLILVFLGPPGAGKGTQAKVLGKELGLSHISTGDLLRAAVNKESELGLKAKSYMDKGELVPDKIVINLVVDELKSSSRNKGFILDGFPRTSQQAESLDLALNDLSQHINLVLYFKTSKATVIERLSGRRVCKNCSGNYHIKNIPPKVDNICDNCGSTLYQREDDKVDTIANRLDVYQEQTAPLIDYYKQKEVLREISGDLDVQDLKVILLEMLQKEQLIDRD